MADTTEALSTILRLLMMLDQKIELMYKNLSLSANTTHMAVKMTPDSASITAPDKRDLRDEVRAYIDTLENFDAKPIPGGYDSRLELVKYALSEANPGKDDIALEFGVWQGKSLSVISQLCPGPVFGFDSFEGLPISEQIWKKGQFNNPQGLTHPVGANTQLVKGWFKDTIPPFVEAHDMTKVKFVHMDCDIYTSAKEIFAMALEKMPQEFVLLLDEYWNYEDWKNGEFKAFHDFLAKTNRSYSYIAFMDSGQQVCVRVHAA